VGQGGASYVERERRGNCVGSRAAFKGKKIESKGNGKKGRDHRRYSQVISGQLLEKGTGERDLTWWDKEVSVGFRKSRGKKMGVASYFAYQSSVWHPNPKNGGGRRVVLPWTGLL